MSKEQENKVIATRWLEGLWGHSWSPKIVDDLAAADILIQFSLQRPCHGKEQAKEFLIGIHQAVANLEFHGDPHLVADGDRVICGLEGGGTHTGSAFMDCLIGFLPANSGRKLHLAGTTVLRIRDGKVFEDATRMTWVSLLPRFRKAAAYLDNDVTRPSQPQPDPRRSR
jgi:hypothetical protein